MPKISLVAFFEGPQPKQLKHLVLHALNQRGSRLFWSKARERSARRVC